MKDVYYQYLMPENLGDSWDYLSTVIAVNAQNQRLESFYDVLFLKDTDKHFITHPNHPMHRHDFYSIWWMIDGESTYVLDDKSYSVKGGTIGFIAPEQLCAFKSSAFASGFCFNFTESPLLVFNTELSYTLKFELFRNTPFLRLRYPESVERLRKAFDSLLELTQRPDDGKVHKYNLLYSMSKLLCEILETREFKEQESESRHPHSVHYKYYMQFVRLVEKHYKEKHQVSDYLQMMDITSGTLLRALKHCYVKKKPLQIIHERMLMEAKRLLLYSTCSIQEIARQLRLHDKSNFIKLFLQYEGCSPIDYREKNKDGIFSGILLDI